jgi:hypothetical protein
MSILWRTIRSYIWWTYERGSIHFDIMVTLILAFIFLAPIWINFGDKPTARNPHQTEVVVVPQGDQFIYQIDAVAVHSTADPGIREDLQRIIEPIAGEVKLLRYEQVRDSKGRVTSYKVWGRKPYH